MQKDFHYYGTYCAAYLAGYDHGECLDIAYSAQLVDLCSRTLLYKLKAPMAAATTQLQLELMQARTDFFGLQDITRIWASFHFLPQDLYAVKKRACKEYRNKYRLICGPNGPLLSDTVNLAKGKGLQAAGMAMHILADTWAHRYFAGTPSLAINNTNYYFYEMLPKEDGEGYTERKISLIPSPGTADDPEKGVYVGSLFQFDERSIMNLGHGRAGHLPDYSYIRYKYLPAWGEYDEIIKDNPTDYTFAFTQMIYALKYLRGLHETFETDHYDKEAILPWADEIDKILRKRQIDACADWKAFGEKLSGKEIPDFDLDKYQSEYINASKEDKDDTFFGRFFLAALAQKSMVTNKIHRSGNLLAGVSIDYKKWGLFKIRDYKRLITLRKGAEEE